MAQIVEVFDDIKKGIGDKGFYLLMGAAAIFGIYNLAKGNQEDSADLASTRIVSTVASYPDAVTNANVIIDTLQDSIDYSEGQIIDAIQGSDDDMKSFLEQNFEATNNYINDGFESQKQLLEENFDELSGSLTEIKDNSSSLSGAVSSIQKSYNSGIKEIGKTVGDMYSKLGSLGSSPSSSVQTNQDRTASAKTTSGTGKAIGTSSKSSSTQYYTYKTKSGYNTSTSIVDALKVSTGNYDSKATAATLKKVAAANGIKNYTGTYNQNVTLLSKMKQGKLKKA